jgi:hypothetical protein
MRTMLCVVRLGVLLAVVSGEAHAQSDTTAQPGAVRSHSQGALHRVFEENRGQYPQPEAPFVARLGASRVFVEKNALTFQLVDLADAPPAAGVDATVIGESVPRSGRDVKTRADPPRVCNVRLVFEGASLDAQVSGGVKLNGYFNYFLGADPSEWLNFVPTYSSVRVAGLYPGIDLELALPRTGGFKYDVHVAPGADLGRFRVRVEGAEGVEQLGPSRLAIRTALGMLEHSIPVSWAAFGAGARQEIAAVSPLGADGSFGLATAGQAAGQAVVVDPLLWSTYLGGGGNEFPEGVAIDGAGAITVVGSSASSNYPTTPGVIGSSLSGTSDAVLTRLAPDGSSLVWSTFLGGSGNDGAWDVAVSAAVVATVVGLAGASFPTTTGGFDASFNGAATDGFVARVAADGASLLWSTYLGGAAADEARAVAIDAADVATVVGLTESSDFPTTSGTYDTSFGGASDAFVARIAADGATLTWSTFLGGPGPDYASGIALDGDGSPIIVGATNSSVFPTTTGAFATAYGGAGDAFVTRIGPTGSALAWSTFLGGEAVDVANDVVVDATGAATVVGFTQSAGFPTTAGVAFPAYGGALDGFVVRVVSDGSTLAMAEFLGGAGADDARGVALDAWGYAVVVGGSSSPSVFAVGSASSLSGGVDAFVTRVAPDGQLQSARYFGGNGSTDVAREVALDQYGMPILVGWTNSTDLPSWGGGFDPTPNGGFDGFVTKTAEVPIVTGVSPTEGFGGETVSISGRWFSPEVAVSFRYFGCDYPTVCWTSFVSGELLEFTFPASIAYGSSWAVIEAESLFLWQGTLSNFVPPLTVSAAPVSLQAGPNVGVTLFATVGGGPFTCDCHPSISADVPTTLGLVSFTSDVGNFLFVDLSGYVLVPGLVNVNAYLPCPTGGSFYAASTAIPVLCAGSPVLALAGGGAVGDFSVTNLCGPPGSLYFTAITFDPANATSLGTGWWGGLHISLLELASEVVNGYAYGPGLPFVGILDANGESWWGLPPGSVPPGFPPMYAVTRTLTFDWLTITGTSNLVAIQL